MEGVNIGVPHESLTAGLNNLNNVSSVSLWKSPTVHAGPTNNQHRPMKDVTNSTRARLAKLKSGRTRVSVVRGPYSKDDAVPKRDVGESASGLRTVYSIPKTSEVLGSTHKCNSGGSMSDRPPDPGPLNAEDSGPSPRASAPPQQPPVNLDHARRFELTGEGDPGCFHATGGAGRVAARVTTIQVPECVAYSSRLHPVNDQRVVVDWEFDRYTQ